MFIYSAFVEGCCAIANATLYACGIYILIATTNLLWEHYFCYHYRGIIINNPYKKVMLLRVRRVRESKPNQCTITSTSSKYPYTLLFACGCVCVVRVFVRTVRCCVPSIMKRPLRESACACTSISCSPWGPWPRGWPSEGWPSPSPYSQRSTHACPSSGARSKTHSHICTWSPAVRPSCCTTSTASCRPVPVVPPPGCPPLLVRRCWVLWLVVVRGIRVWVQLRVVGVIAL